MRSVRGIVHCEASPVMRMYLEDGWTDILRLMLRRARCCTRQRLRWSFPLARIIAYSKWLALS
ncbi:MAG: hypothetical protein ABI229_02890, partial [Gemmatimonadaceae bacterium]